MSNHSRKLRLQLGILHQLSQKGADPTELFAELKHTFEPRDASAILKKFYSRNSRFHSVSFGRPIVRSYENLICGPASTQWTEDWKRELAWNIHSLVAYSDLLKPILDLLYQFETEFLGGNYLRADQTLQAIETISVSWWSLDCRFLLAEHQVGFEKNKELLSDFNKHNKDAIARILASFASQRAERKMSPARYRQIATSFYDELKSYKVDTFAQFFRYQTGLAENIGESDCAAILYWALETPVFDRYLISLEMGQRMAAMCPESRSFLSSIFGPLEQKLRDPKLASLMTLCNPSRVVTPRLGETQILPIVDLYTAGNYSDCLDASLHLLNTRPAIPELYELAVKSRLQHSPLDISDPIAAPRCPRDIILNNLFSIVGRGGNVPEAERQLSKMAQMLRQFGISFWLDSILYVNDPNKDSWALRAQALLQTSLDNPHRVELFRNSSHAISVLDRMLNDHEESITVRFWRCLHSMRAANKVEDVELPIPPSRKHEYLGYVCRDLGRYAEAVGHFKATLSLLRRQERPIPYATEKVIVALVESLISARSVDSALELFVEAFLQNHWIASRMPIPELVRTVSDHPPPLPESGIRIAILVYLAHNNPLLTHIAYDNFFLSLGIQRPTQLLPLRDNFDKKELVYFLSKACTAEVMSHSVYFDSTSALEEERILLCRFLNEFDPDNKDHYAEEISRIAQAKLIRSGVQEVEESKIYVDVERLKSSAETSFRESYERYREFTAVTERNELQLIQADAKMLAGVLQGRQGASSFYFLVHPSFVLFRELFLELRDRFIASNEYGLDSYLSVRIRHGTLLGQLRRPFETHRLVTQKDQQTQVYFPNEYWRIAGEPGASIQSWLSILSQKVDEQTTKVKQEWIQITTEKDPKPGLFDFHYSEVALVILHKNHFQEITEYAQFVETALAELWERTEINLQSIRERITSELKSNLVDHLTSLYDNVRPLSGTSAKAAELVTAIATCRTDIQHELEHICRWFTISQRKLARFTLDQMVQTALSIFNTTYPNVHFLPIIHASCSRDLDGKYFPAFVDILIVLFTNIHQHCGLAPHQWNTEICIELDGERMRLRVKNHVANHEISNRAVKHLTATNQKLSSKDALEIVRREGGSGHAKIHKLLKFDLARDTYLIEGASDELIPAFEVAMGFSIKGLS